MRRASRADAARSRGRPGRRSRKLRGVLRCGACPGTSICRRCDRLVRRQDRRSRCSCEWLVADPDIRKARAWEPRRHVRVVDRRARRHCHFARGVATATGCGRGRGEHRRGPEGRRGIVTSCLVVQRDRGGVDRRPGLLQGSGIGPRRLTRAIGVYKAYCSRVGEGPFPPSSSMPRPSVFARSGMSTAPLPVDRAASAGSTPSPAAIRRESTRSTASPHPPGLLDGFDELRVCSAYEVDGEAIDYFPARSRPWIAAIPLSSLCGLGRAADRRPRLGRSARECPGLRSAPGGPARSPRQLIGVGEGRGGDRPALASGLTQRLPTVPDWLRTS